MTAENVEEDLRGLLERQYEAHLLRAVATAANEARDLRSALRRATKHVCRHLGWNFAHVWLVSEDGALISSGVTAQPRSSLTPFASVGFMPHGDRSIPALVLASRMPVWICNLRSQDFPRRAFFEDCALRTAAAFPLLIGKDVAGVAEFFTEEDVPEDQRFLDLAQAIGAQLGRVIERERSREALERAKRELELRVDAANAANRAKSAFLANMSHEIRTPMTAVLGYAELLLDVPNACGEIRSHAEAIRRSGKHLLAILNDILDLSKIEAGRLVIERVPCSPGAVIDAVTEMLRPSATEKQLSLQLEIDDRVPQSALTDPTRLRQIALNLIGNAIKFTELGSVRVKLQPAQLDSSPAIRLEVEDQGIGMSEEQLPLLFKPFSQADASTTRRFGGTGLGLAITKRLVELLGGQIEVESKLGVGSRFVVTIPVERADAVADPVSGDLIPASSRGAARRVLLAEDVRLNQLLIASILRRAGLEVEVVANGREAVTRTLSAAAAGEPFDLVLMDVQMPELDGYAATRALRDAGYEGRIVALTAHAMVSDREMSFAAGCDGHLTKPIDRAALLETLGAQGRS